MRDSDKKKLGVLLKQKSIPQKSEWILKLTALIVEKHQRKDGHPEADLPGGHRTDANALIQMMERENAEIRKFL